MPAPPELKSSITHEVDQLSMDDALVAIRALPEVSGLAAHLGCL